MKRAFSVLLWLGISLLGVFAYVTLAVHRGEPLNSAYILTAALCTYAIGYRFYSKWISARVLMLNDRRATPCEAHEDGTDYVKTNKWIVFGHHFAAISGPGPLVGPVLAAQFGYLPGTLWILIGVVLGGAVQDLVILFASMRRDGKSLGQMVKDELGTAAGVIGTIAILGIMIILLAVLALVVVKALAESSWGVFTVGATIPIAMLMGGYLRFWRVGKVLEASAFGVVFLLLAVWGGQYVHASASLSPLFTVSAMKLAVAIIVYGFAASVLPVWLLLAPRDYLSTFMKLGTIGALAIGIFFVLPDLKMPAVTKFVDGTGLVVPGKLFPFCFITIACGAISGFHTLIASGITPKIITRESYARPIGYGAMCLESLVAIMAMIAACTLQPEIYLGMNVASAGADSNAKAAAITKKLADVGASEFRIDAVAMDRMAAEVQETTLFNRTGGAATLAVGMANIFSRLTHGRWLGIWYHFAIMFEALFILTTLDAGTRVGRYLLQDALGHISKPLGNTRSHFANIVASLLIVCAWGYFLIQGVLDPDGGVKALWPLFGIANQLLAAIALCFATTILLKMQLRSDAGSGALRKPVIALVTLLPLLWLLSVTMTAGVQKIFHSSKAIGFIAAREFAQQQRPALEAALKTARTSANADAINLAQKALRANHIQIVNNTVDTVVAAVFLILVVLIVLISVREWILLLARKKVAELRETAATWLPDYALAESRPLHVTSLIALGFALLRELSGEAKVDRMVQQSSCAHHQCADARAHAYLQSTEQRFKGINRCC